MIDDSGSGTATVTFVADATASYEVEVAAFDANATGAYGVVTMNTTSSTIQQLEIISDPGADGIYSVEDDIQVRVIFSSVVEVTGTPQLALDIGGITRQASYTEGTGDQILIFSYTVAEGDSDTDGIAIGADSVTTPGGSGMRAGGMDVPLQHDAVPADSGHKVNGQRRSTRRGGSFTGAGGRRWGAGTGRGSSVSGPSASPPRRRRK